MSKKLYNLAFVFPGQGSQSVGMMNNLAAVFPEVRQTFTEASDVLGFDLWQIVTDFKYSPNFSAADCIS